LFIRIILTFFCKAYSNTTMNVCFSRKKPVVFCLFNSLTACIGFVLVSKKLYRIRKKAYEAAERFIEAWDILLTGQIYGYEVLNPEGDDVHSCWGYWGDKGIEEATIQAKDIIDYDIQKRAEERAECTLTEVGCIL